MTILSNEQIVEKFKKSSIHISKVECKGAQNGMICVIYRDYPNFFPSYFTAYNYYNQRNLLNN